MRILGQIADKANLLGVAAKKKLVEDEKTKLNEAIKSFCNDALAFLAALPEVETEKGQRPKASCHYSAGPQTQNAR